MEDIEKILNFKSYIDLWSLIFKEYHNLIDVFEKWNADKLLSYHKDHDFKIKLKSDKISLFKSLYRMSCEELMILQQYLDKYLAKEFIQLSHSFFASPVLFVKKPGGDLWFYIDYWVLNAIIIWNWYLISLIQKTLNHLAKTCYFTKLDVVAAFNQIHVKKSDEKYTAFQTW